MDTVEVRFFKLCMRLALLLQCFWECLCHCQGTECCYDNGHLRLEFCSEHQLVITNTLFQQKDRFKATWKHPHSKRWNLLDYTLTRQHDTRDILHARVTPSADCCTDHRLVHRKVAYTWKPPPKRKGSQMEKLQLHILCDQRWKTIFRSCWRKGFIVWQLQSLKNSVSRWRPYYTSTCLHLQSAANFPSIILARKTSAIFDWHRTCELADCPAG